MDAVATAGDLPVKALLGRRVEEPGVPRQRHGNGPSVFQPNAQRVLTDANVGHSFIRGYRQKTHTSDEKQIPRGLKSARNDNKKACTPT